MIKRSFLKPSSLPRRSAPKKKARSKAERLRIYGPPGFIEWCHEQPCIACGVVGFSEVAHIKTGGTGRKDDWTRTVPLCGSRISLFSSPFAVTIGCHKDYDAHRLGLREMPDVLAAEIQSRWLAHTEEPPLASVSPVQRPLLLVPILIFMSSTLGLIFLRGPSYPTSHVRPSLIQGVTNWRHFAEGYAKIVPMSRRWVRVATDASFAETSWTATKRLPCPVCTPDSAMRESPQ